MSHEPKWVRFNDAERYMETFVKDTSPVIDGDTLFQLELIPMEARWLRMSKGGVLHFYDTEGDLICTYSGLDWLFGGKEECRINAEEVERLKTENAKLWDREGKSYVEIQPALAESLERFAEVLGDHPEGGNTIWAYTMAACNEIERLTNEHMIWEKHGLVEIVTERNAMREALVAQRYYEASKCEHYRQCDLGLSPSEGWGNVDFNDMIAAKNKALELREAALESTAR